MGLGGFSFDQVFFFNSGPRFNFRFSFAGKRLVSLFFKPDALDGSA